MERAPKRGGSVLPQETEPGVLDTFLSAPSGSDTIDRSIRRKEIDDALQSFIPDRLDGGAGAEGDALAAAAVDDDDGGVAAVMASMRVTGTRRR